MPSTIEVGNEIKVIDIFKILPPQEGEINIYYGRIGEGKTSAGTRNIFRELKRGEIVYSNWNIKWRGYDQRNSWWYIFLGAIGLKKEFFHYPKENLHFWNFVKQEIDGKPCPPFIDQLSVMTDCSIHLDEGHIPFDSYEATRMSEKKRSAVFATRHFDRKLTIYTQRANSVHINLRGNTNRFYKCEKLHDWELFKKRFIQFQITEFQDLSSTSTIDETRMKDEEGNETGEYIHAVSQETYWGRKKLFESFDSKYLRGNMKHSQGNYAKLYKLTYAEILNQIKQKIRKKKQEIQIQPNMGNEIKPEERTNLMDKNTWTKK